MASQREAVPHSEARGPGRVENERSEHLKLELDLLEGALRSASPGAAPAGGGTRAVLIVGSDAELRSYIRRCMRAGPHAGAIIEATDSAGALEVLARQPVELVIAEADVSGVDGAELCVRIRKQTDTGTVPVLLVLGNPVGRHVAAYYYHTIRANGLLAKPFNATKLCALVEALTGMLAEDSPADATPPDRGES